MNKEQLRGLTWLINQLAIEYMYSDANKKDFDAFYDYMKDHLDLKTIRSTEEAESLCFRKWDDESDLWLFPIWLLPLIPNGMVLKSIGDEEFTFDKDTADKDIRFGCLPYGIDIKEESDEGNGNCETT